MLAALATALITCTSPGIIDGDTIRCASERVRLWGVNSPERGEPGYGEASRHLAQLTTGKVVVCKPPPTGQDRDRYGRAVRVCFFGPRDLGREQVRAGHAVDMPRYSKGFYAR